MTLSRKQNIETHEIINALQALETRAHAAGLTVTGQAINNAKNAAGWELAGDVVRASKAAREAIAERLYATPPVRGDRETAIRTALKAHGYNDRQIDDPDFINDSFRRNVETTIDAILSVQPGAGEREAVSKGFMTACSGDGEYQIKIGFETLAEMQVAHTALSRLQK